MQIMAAENTADLELLRPLLLEAAVKVDAQRFGLPAWNPDRTIARLGGLVGRPDAIVLIMSQSARVVGYMALHAVDRVAIECGFYMENFANTRQLVDAAKRWALALRCTVLKITSAHVPEETRPRILNLLHKRGGFEKYAEVYTVKL